MYNKKRTVIFAIFLIAVTSLVNYVSVYYVLKIRASNDPLHEFGKLSQVIQIVQSRFVEPVDGTSLLEGSLKGAVKALGDPYSEYMSADEWREFMVNSSGSYDGIGLVIGAKDGYTVVISPIKGSPAARAGILKGDIVVQVDGTDIYGFSPDKVAQMIRGRAGSKVTLKIKRQDTADLLEFVVVRENITIPSAEGRMLNQEVGYLQITQFYENAFKETREVLDGLLKSGAKGLIVDLRGNPGGRLDQCVEIAQLLVPKGPIVSVVDRNGNEEKFVSKSEGLKIPLVVLVDGGSASASEILAGAVKDRGAGVIVGTKTFGKGSVQNLIPLSDGSGIKLTTAKYYTPSGKSIHGTGIEPDVEVNNPNPASTQPAGARDLQLEKALEIVTSLIHKKTNP